MKTPKNASLHEKLPVSAKSMIFMLFHEMSKFLQLLVEKLMKTPKHASLLEKLLVSAKSMIFHAFSQNQQLFATFGLKVDENAEIC